MTITNYTFLTTSELCSALKANQQQIGRLMADNSRIADALADELLHFEDSIEYAIADTAMAGHFWLVRLDDCGVYAFYNGGRRIQFNVTHTSDLIPTPPPAES